MGGDFLCVLYTKQIYIEYVQYVKHFNRILGCISSKCSVR